MKFVYSLFATGLAFGEKLLPKGSFRLSRFLTKKAEFRRIERIFVFSVSRSSRSVFHRCFPQPVQTHRRNDPKNAEQEPKTAPEAVFLWETLWILFITVSSKTGCGKFFRREFSTGRRFVEINKNEWIFLIFGKEDSP